MKWHCFQPEPQKVKESADGFRNRVDEAGPHRLSPVSRPTPPFCENVSFENNERLQFSSNVRVLVAERSVPMVRKNAGV
jgi:hypothetical protein